jgi:hypothetical protein
VHTPACVVKCLTTGRWFCNGRIHSSGTCIVLHLVKSKNKEVQLHKDSPLGDTVLECYATGSRNVFTLGFVPVKSENTVVLLARDTPPNHPTIRDLDLDLAQVGSVAWLGSGGVRCESAWQHDEWGASLASCGVAVGRRRMMASYTACVFSCAALAPQWQPIVEDRGLVSWLVKQPGEKELLRARALTLAQARRAARRLADIA